VLFDSEIFSLQVYGGISRYVVELLKHLPNHGVRPLLIAPITFNHHLAETRPRGFYGAALPSRSRNRYTKRLARTILRLSDELTSRMAPFDVLHRTYYGRRFTHVPRRVTTVVDMIPEMFPEMYPAGTPHRGKAVAVTEAALVLCISHRTKQDLQRLMPGLRAPIRVVHLAVDAEFFAERAGRDAGEDRTLLFVGDRGGYKNFDTFANASARLLVERPDLRVVVVGGGPLSSGELAPFVERGNERRVHQRSATDAELPALYRGAVVFVFPSHYEGFGLPILEAFASGCPVALSNASCFPEIADEAGLYFDPHNADSLLEVLRRVTSDAGLRSELRARGAARLREFSWDRTAQQTAAAYREVVDVSQP
jgi:glycosyltransferase involved in cell wall biosynthesis